MLYFIHKFLNIAVPTFTFFSLCFLLPPFLFYKFCISILDYFVRENLTEKVVLITGASSGIGEHLAYEYARRGACLALAARRENQLREVVDQARQYGSPDVIMIVADVCKVEDCKRLVDETVNHFGRLDHLVNNAGITSACMFEDSIDITDFRAIMDTNFWGSVYTTRFAVPHLRNSQGRIIVMSSGGSWLPIPRMSIYNASKAALLMMFDTLRIELGPDVKITIVTPGFIESELTQGKLFVREGKLSVDQELRDVQVSITPVGSVKGCAKAIVNGACKGQRYLTEPAWYKVTYIWRVLCPEMVDLYYRLMYLTKPGSPDKEAPSKKILDLIGAKKLLYPETILSPDVKVD